MINTSNFFDLYDIYVNELIGDPIIAIIISLIIVWILTIKAKMPFELSILFGILLLIIFFAETFMLIIWVFIVLFIGILFYWMVSKAIDRS